MARRDYDDDEYEEEAPRSKRATAVRDDDDEDEPRPSKKASRSPVDDDDDEPAPRKRRPVARDEDDDDEPAPRRRPAARDEEDDDEPAPRRRPSKAVDEDDDDEPAPRRRAAKPAGMYGVVDEEDDEPAPRKRSSRARDDDDDDDDEPAPKKRTGPSKSAKQPQAGWGAGDKVRDTSSTYAKSYVPEAGQKDVIKFIPDKDGEVAPYSSFKRHWLKLSAGNRPFTCIEPYDDRGCPLCDMGDRPSAVYAFNIAIIPKGEAEPTMRSWEAGTQLYEQFKNFNGDKATGPLARMYYYVTRGSGKSARTAVSPVRERDLEEDYDRIPLSKDELADLVKNRYTSDIVQIPTRKELRDLIASFED